MMLHERLTVVAAWLRPLVTFALGLVGAAAAVVVLVQLAPGDVIDAIGPMAPDTIDTLRAEWCVGCPWYAQLGHRLGGMLQGDLGTSLAYRRGMPVLELVWPALVRSLVTVGMGLVCAFIAATAAVVLRRRGGRPGRLFVALGAFGCTVPAFLVAIVVWRVAAPLLGLDVGVLHLAVAATILGLADAGFTDLSSRLQAEVRRAAKTDHVLAARANGDRALIIMTRTLAGPVLELAATRFSVLLGAVMMVEIPLGIYGVGEVLAGGAASRDIPVVVGCLLLLAVAVCTVHLLADLTRTGLDPRLRRPVVEG